MKVYFAYDGEPKEGNLASKRLDREEYKVKITLPAKWITGPCEKLLTFFVDTYNKKFGADKALVADEMFLRCRGVDLPLEAEVSKYVEEYNDVCIVHKQAVVKSERAPEGSLTCTNFGCGKHYLPDQNTDETACRYHAKGPVFHDLAKYWGCCPDKKANDWKEFEEIEPCCVGVHSVANAPVNFSAPPSAKADVSAQALSEEQAKAFAQGTASTATEYVDTSKPCRGPREFEGGQEDAPGKVREDGTASCRNAGCQKDFVVAQNTDTSCTHHTGKPVFWDTYKYWSCCPDKKHIDFDDFVKVPGCAVGCHKL